MILSYHNIATEKGFYTVPLSLFRQQVTLVSECYQVTDLDTYIARLKEHGNPGRLAVITFDDAYVSYAALALPVLEELNLPSTVFVCTGVIGRSNEWDGPEHRFPVMDAATIKKLAAHPLVTIGAHTVSHPSLAALDEAGIRRELTESRQYLESLLQQKVDYLAYPFGQLHLNVDRRVARIAQETGYKAACTTCFNNRNTPKELYTLNRLDITPDDAMDIFTAKLRHFNFYYFKQKLKNLYYLLRKRG